MHITTFVQEYSGRKIEGIKQIRDGLVIDFQGFGLKEAKDLTEYLLGIRQLTGEESAPSLQPEIDALREGLHEAQRDLDAARADIRNLNLRLQIIHTTAAGGRSCDF